jgi:Zn finger protein HypA/HybF involved in hydrogenase expression
MSNPYKQKQKREEVIVMCSVGGTDFEFEIEEIEVERYKCNDCGNKFDAMGEKVICPSCQSENVVKA